MKRKLLKISLYWKCQLLGWLGFLFIIIFFDIMIYWDFLEFIPFAVSIFIFGLFFSHLLKMLIEWLGVLKKRFSFQLLYLSALTIIFSFFGTYVWMIIMIKAGIWEIEEPINGHSGSFLKEYFFNLFTVLMTFSGWVLIYFLYHYVQGVRREEQLAANYKLQMIELEAKALRAQMNPHFIFNCLNSIKSLIQQNENEKSVTYLTTFSKLIRTLLNNADKKEISLFDEIETCKLYLQLEAMRFDAKFSYAVNVDETIDLKSIQVPALIIQPFIENAIWHGIVPHNSGGHVSLNVKHRDGIIEIVIDDDGIGREASKQNRAASGLTHQSKGVNLTQSRLELNNLLQQRQAELETIDKKDENGVATGTKVIIKIKEELS